MAFDPERDDHEVATLTEYMEAVEEVRVWLNEREVWYRGHRKAKWPLQPFIYRNTDRPKTFETELYNHFQAKAWQRIGGPPPLDYVGHWLCLMRHYGLPTRLLDWSASPLIAAYFALWENPIDSPVVWALNPFVLNESMGVDVPMLVLGKLLNQVELYAQLVEVEGKNYTWLKRSDSILAVWPPEIDNRLLVQQSRMTIHAVPTPLEEIDFEKPTLKRIAIKHEVAEQLREAISGLGIRESHLFPDLDRAASELKQVWQESF